MKLSDCIIGESYHIVAMTQDVKEVSPIGTGTAIRLMGKIPFDDDTLFVIIAEGKRFNLISSFAEKISVEKI